MAYKKQNLYHVLLYGKTYSIIYLIITVLQTYESFSILIKEASLE